MIFLILSIFCSVSVGVIFKLSRKYSVQNTQIISFNYLIAILLGLVFFKPELSTGLFIENWPIFSGLMLLLPSVFLFLALSVKNTGIVRTDAAQRLSLFIPILAAWLIFGEKFNLLKVLGLLTGFAALLLILNKKNNSEKTSEWYYPALVFIGFGIIDILFKKVALITAAPYTTSLTLIFCGALIFSLFTVLYEIIFLKKKFGIINLLFGALVGIFNFGNILFYLKAHRAFSENPSTVFAAMNMGVIITGSLVGIFFFKEKLSSKNYLGLILALFAIILIVLSQIFK